MALSLQRRDLTGNAYAIGHEKLVGLLELDAEQTIEGVLKRYFALATPLSHGGGHAAPIP
jgi:hypothetical protein